MYRIYTASAVCNDRTLIATLYINDEQLARKIARCMVKEYSKQVTAPNALLALYKGRMHVVSYSVADRVAA